MWFVDVTGWCRGFSPDELATSRCDIAAWYQQCQSASLDVMTNITQSQRPASGNVIALGDAPLPLLRVRPAIKPLTRPRPIFAPPLTNVNHKYHRDLRFWRIRLSIRLVKSAVLPDVIQSAIDCIQKNEIHSRKGGFWDRSMQNSAN